MILHIEKIEVESLSRSHSYINTSHSTTIIHAELEISLGIWSDASTIQELPCFTFTTTSSVIPGENSLVIWNLDKAKIRSIPPPMKIIANIFGDNMDTIAQ